MNDTMKRKVLWPYIPHLLVGAALIAVLFSKFGMRQQADPDFNVSVLRPAYTELHPKVLFDEAHNNFHTSVGRYKPLTDLLTKDGFDITPNHDRFEARTLLGYRVLVIANAVGNNERGDGPAFSESECLVVRDWVKAGGALLLVTDIAPMGAPSEMLAEQFGVEMSKGITQDPAHCDPRTASATNLVFERADGLLATHPITNGRDDSERINRIVTFTGQSLKGPPGSTALLRLSATAEDLMPAVTEVEGVDGFPEKMVTNETPVSASGRAQGVALEYGRGRVVVLGEAGMLSAQVASNGSKNFGMNLPGTDNKQFSLNIMHWLCGLI